MDNTYDQNAYIKDLCSTLTKLYREWSDVYQNGINVNERRAKQFTDGALLSATRQRIIGIKQTLSAGTIPVFDLPNEFYYPLPPEVSYTYMAHTREVQTITRVITPKEDENLGMRYDKDVTELVEFRSN